MAMMKCPHCGWEYNPKAVSQGHSVVPLHKGQEGGGGGYYCAGSEQHPRNAETDKRPLWKDGGVQ